MSANPTPSGATALAIFASRNGDTIMRRGEYESGGRCETYEAIPID